MKSLLILMIITTSQAAFAMNECRDLKLNEKNELKIAVCQSIVKMHARSEKIDLNQCLRDGRFNLCENLDFGATGTNIQVSRVLNSRGLEFTCDADVRSNAEIINLDCNGNY